MRSRHKLGTSPNAPVGSGGTSRGVPRRSECLTHLSGMDTNSVTKTPKAPETFEPLLSTTELAARLQVSVQRLYDLRSPGRGPRGFRVGRVLRFRASEVRAWLARMEADDAARHLASHTPAP